ncbi:unnamed protein product [Amaranthus hypochondriacus]
MVECLKSAVARNKEHAQALQDWRAKFSKDPSLSTLVRFAPRERVLLPSVEIDNLIKFLSEVICHFHRMCRASTGVPFQSNVELIEHCDNYYPDMMMALYKSLEILSSNYRSKN